jgi:hypothetical protein
MSYGLVKEVTPEVAICSFSSSGSGNVTFVFDSGSFTPSIATTVITLPAGYEYHIISSPAAVSAPSTVNHIVNGVSETGYAIISTGFASGLDQIQSSIIADASVTFSLACNSATGVNSRLQIWRFPL